MSNQSLKRSYGTSSTAPFQAAPPLPPGPPPPPPAQPAPAINPYANYGYAYPTPPVPVVAPPHPGYASYGYGAATAVPQQQKNYAYTHPLPPNPQQYAHPQPAYASHQFQQPQYAVPPPPPPGYAPPPPPPLVGPQQPQQPYPSYAAYPPQQFQPAPPPQPYYSQPLSITPLAQHSPQGTPPFKRPRYDSTGALQGPPPIQDSGASNFDSGRGGRGRGNFGDRGRGRGGFRDGSYDERSSNGGSPGPPSSRGGYRGRGGDRGGYSSRGGSNYNSNQNSGSLRGVPSGPSERGGRGGRGRGGSERSRPMSGLPTAPTNSNQFDPSLPKGPRSNNITRPPLGSNVRSGKKPYPRDERKEEVNKKTLTDFRIGELSIEELEWSWIAEKAIVEKESVSESKLEAEDVGVVEEGDMSLEISNESSRSEVIESVPIESELLNEDEMETTPKKKITKSQRKAQNKRNAAAAKKMIEGINLEPESSAQGGSSELPASSEKLVDGEVEEILVVVKEESEELSKKKDAKHGRDEESDSDTSSAAVLAAKKVKADNGQSLNLSTPPLDPAPPASKKSDNINTNIPTGPREGTPVVPPPLGRENSRLRIYFSSPIEVLERVVISEQSKEEMLKKKKKIIEGVEEVEVESEELKVELGSGDVDLDGEEIDDLQDSESVLDQSDQSDTEEESSMTEKSLIPEAVVPTSKDPAVEQESATEVNPLDLEKVEKIEKEITPSPDRMSISYAKNTRRLVLDAAVIKSVQIYRKEGKIEITVGVEEAAGEKNRVCRGVIVEMLDDLTDEYRIISRASLLSTLDPLLPPLHQLFSSSTDGIEVQSPLKKEEITLVANLDRSNPLTEARWVKTGDIEGWITQLSLGSTKGDVSSWKGKIRVVDPDPPPTIESALESWSTTSQLGTQSDRTKFINNHLLPSIDNTLEILLRLTRPPVPPPQAPSLSVLAANLSAPYPDSQTQISLAVLAMFRLSVETARKAGNGTEEVEKGVREIVRGIPYYLIFKSLDGMFRDWKGGKKISGSRLS